MELCRVMVNIQSSEIMTPCIKKCVMNEKGYCTGCLRSMREIAGWAEMTNEERARVMAELTARKAALFSKR